MHVVEIISEDPFGFCCPVCGAPFYAQKPKFCEHLLFCYDTLSGEFGFNCIEAPVVDIDEPAPENLFEYLPDGAVCFVIHSSGPGGLQNTSYIAVEMGSRVVGELSTAQVAEKTGLTVKRIQQLGSELVSCGLARRIGKVLVCSPSAIRYIQNRPEKRGAHLRYDQ